MRSWYSMGYFPPDREVKCGVAGAFKAVAMHSAITRKSTHDDRQPSAESSAAAPSPSAAPSSAAGGITGAKQLRPTGPVFKKRKQQVHRSSSPHIAGIAPMLLPVPTAPQLHTPIQSLVTEQQCCTSLHHTQLYIAHGYIARSYITHRYIAGSYTARSYIATSLKATPHATMRMAELCAT